MYFFTEVGVRGQGNVLISNVDFLSMHTPLLGRLGNIIFLDLFVIVLYLTRLSNKNEENT